MKGLYLDDLRTPRSITDVEWNIVRDYDQFTSWITKHGLPDIISFDHDLSDLHTKHFISQAGIPFEQMAMDYTRLDKTGYHCAKWLCDYCIDNNVELPKKITVHSANPCGADNIMSYLNCFCKTFNYTSQIYRTSW